MHKRLTKQIIRDARRLAKEVDEKEKRINRLERKENKTKRDKDSLAEYRRLRRVVKVK